MTASIQLTRGQVARCDERDLALLAKIKRLARQMKEAAGAYGFACFVFDFGDSGTITYASNAQRADMIKAVRELLDRLEREEGAN